MPPHARDDRRYQVFVSSTYSDLMAERQEVIATLLELDAFPAGMELFPAADDDAWTIIKRVIDESDYYLLIIGGRYGSVSEAQVGYTEMEYDYATQIKKPVMAFLHKNPDDIASGKTEKTDDGRERLETFRAKVKTAKHVKFWENKDDLAGHVARTFSKFTRDYPAVGWTRASAETAEELELNLAKARLRIAELESEKAAPSAKAPDGTDELAQGDELVGFMIHFKYQWDDPAKPTYQQRSHGFRWFEIAATWDEVFASIAPKLLNEASEADMQKALESWMLEYHFEEIFEKALEGFEGEQREARDETMSSIDLTIDQDAFSVIVLQLNALGLVGKSEKKRSVREASKSYWTLTPWGLAYATRLRARRRGSEPSIHTINTESTAPTPDDEG
ncbi:DUF4062 domain-containing protein [Aeromicrobium halocynthiae]|uniref:DUF4062 domain-containing protein n=1 Tax=Aeromicrobium halocynthiae TaxID=560557 RepID=A0ABN2W6X2_9ACTN